MNPTQFSGLSLFVIMKDWQVALISHSHSESSVFLFVFFFPSSILCDFLKRKFKETLKKVFGKYLHSGTCILFSRVIALEHTNPQLSFVRTDF